MMVGDLVKFHRDAALARAAAAYSFDCRRSSGSSAPPTARESGGSEADRLRSGLKLAISPVLS